MMTRKVFNRLKSICRAYDPFTQYIDSYRQQQSAERSNSKLEEEFDEIVSQYTPDGAGAYIPWDLRNCSGQELEDGLLEALNKWGIEVEPRRIWTEEEIDNLIRTNNQMLINTLKKTSIFSFNSKFLEKSDRKVIDSIFSYYLNNDSKITLKQAELARAIYIKYIPQLTELANSID